jgi:hypothetical protein
MKNRTKERIKNGKIFCKHDWKIAENIGRDWDLVVGIKILCECKKCGKLKYRYNFLIDEVPDEKINKNIVYLP